MSKPGQLSENEVGADKSVDIGEFAGGHDLCAVAGLGRLDAVMDADSGREAIGKVVSLRSLVLLAVLAALAGCKDFGKKIELHDPHAGERVSGEESFLIDPSTGKIIFGGRVKDKPEKGVQPEKVAGRKEEDEGGLGGEDGAEGGADGRGFGKGAKLRKGASGGFVSPAASGILEAQEDPRRKVIEEYIRAVFKPLITASDIVLPSKDVERDVTFSSSGREVKVHVKISASHLVGVKSRLVGTAQLAYNKFFGDTGEYLDEETLRERLLAEKTSAIGGSISRVEATGNPNWPLPVSMDDAVLAGLTKAVTEKFSTKGGKMQAIADFAVAAVKYKASEERAFSKFPSLTLADGVGDCKDFSVLVAAMGKIAGVDCAFAEFKDEEHMDVACALDGEGTAFVLDGVRYEWVNVTTFLRLYGSKGMGITTNHDGIGVLPDTFGSPEYLQPVFGKPVSVKDLVVSGRLILNENRQ